MLTFPFIQVEGSMALPRVRPLDRIPVSFGREWMLTPPHFSLRAEIRALYAAIMRTICLSGEAFREIGRWDLQHGLFPTPSAVPARPRATIKVSLPPAKAKAPPPFDVVRSPLQRHVPTPGAHKLAGSACAIGGAALLAWIVASHTPNGTHEAATAVDASPTRNADDTASQRLADTRAAHERTNASAAATDAATGASQAATQTASQKTYAIDAAQRPSQRAASAATSGAAGSTAAQPSTTRPDYAAASHPSTPLRATLSGRTTQTAEGRAHKTRESVRGRASRERIVGVPRVESSRHAAHSFAPHRVAPPVTTHRTLGTYSEASSYSPRQPSVRQDDEYASIATYANTHTAARPASRPSVPVDSTEWVNHLSQRRVTEIPDRFGK
jgi:hypothetical protein